ncbi:hypothetical protein OG594_22265 [Streptomyces sp. NBC_01214]|nr:hypothetical protein [Streptomyces sp. NBC_01214]MCX4804334.1 hypothetical protein [Streptomyces sp. NBC_01214]
MFGVPGTGRGRCATGVEQAEGTVVGLVPQTGVHPMVKEVSQYGMTEDQGAGRPVGPDQVGVSQRAESGRGPVAGIPGHVRGVAGAKGLSQDGSGSQHLGAVARKGFEFGEHRRRGAQQRARRRVGPRRPLAGVVARRQKDTQGTWVTQRTRDQLLYRPATRQGSDGRSVQGCGLHLDETSRVRGVVESGEQGWRGLPGPQGKSQDQRVRGTFLDEGFQQMGRSGIRVVDVVQDEHAPTTAVPSHARIEQCAYQLMICGGAPRRAGLGGGRMGGGHRRLGPLPGITENLVRLDLARTSPGPGPDSDSSPAPQYGGASCDGEPGEQVQQGGLPDARIPSDLEDRASAGAEVLDGPSERCDLLPPPYQRRYL